MFALCVFRRMCQRVYKDEWALVGVQTCARDNTSPAGGQVSGGHPAPSHRSARGCESNPRNGEVMERRGKLCNGDVNHV